MRQDTVSDEEVERRVQHRVVLLCLIFFSLVAAINAASLRTDAIRAGSSIDLRLPWLLELTSAAALLALVPLVILLERRFPLAPGRMASSLAALTVGSLVFSVLHVAGMGAMRIFLVPAILDESYRFLTDPLTELIYEYRKDLFPYVVVLVALTLSRRIEESRQDVAAARLEARETGRLTLKSGGRTMFVDAGDVEWARAAGNYVEIRVAGYTHLPRISLAAIEEQLRAAGVDVVRVHRSHLVNRAMVMEIKPTGDGDVKIRLRDGSEIRGSRRFRDQLAQ